MGIHFYLYNYPALRIAIAAGLLLLAVAIFGTWTDMWRVRMELTRYGVTAQADVTDRSSRLIVHDDEDGDIFQYETKYEYYAYEYKLSDPYGQKMYYSGVSGYRDTYRKAEPGWIQVIYSSREPEISLPYGEFTPTGSFIAWAFAHFGEYLVAIGFLIAALWIIKTDLRNLWTTFREGR